MPFKADALQLGLKERRNTQIQRGIGNTLVPNHENDEIMGVTIIDTTYACMSFKTVISSFINIKRSSLQH